MSPSIPRETSTGSPVAIPAESSAIVKSWDRAPFAQVSQCRMKSLSNNWPDAFGFANAIGVAIDMKVNGFLEKIRADLAGLNAATPAPQPAAL